MPDPFAALRLPPEPVDPDPDFATDLRARVQRALALPRGVLPVTTAPEAESPTRPAAVPYLAVRDARAALDWYVDVFGADVSGAPIVMPDDRIGHAQLAVSGGVLYLSDEHPEIGVTAPRPGEASVSLMLPVDDADAVRARALAAGATGDREAYDSYGERHAWIVDPFGHRWGLTSPSATSVPALRTGDVGAVALCVPDVARAVRFYGRALGWAFAGPSEPDGVQVVGATPAVVIRPGDGELFVAYAVDDLEPALDRVRAAGGTAGAPQPRAYGPGVDCVDGDGRPFGLYEPVPGTARSADDLPYLTLPVRDSSRTRAFYREVLGWQFRPGRVEDGWEVRDAVPMIGLAGGREAAGAVPMWNVPDVGAAIEAVRANGGTATDLQRQSYGTSSECTDDQGMRFYLLGG